MRPLPLANPPNPWATTDVAYLEGEAPNVALQVYEDHTRSILATNDTPDLGFRWSVNPYRGCFHACAYCLDGDTPILMGDGRATPLRDVRAGDVVYGTRFDGKYRRYTRARVTARWQTVKRAYRVVLEDGTSLIASGDHRLLTERGWKYVARDPAWRRPALTTHNSLLGTGAFAAPEEATDDYRRGYLAGLVRGDALLAVYRYARVGRAHGDQYQFRLALADLEPLRRAREYLATVGVTTSDEYVFAEAAGAHRRMVAIRTHARRQVARIQEIVAWPTSPTREWTRGWLAGIFDAEGSFSCHALRISNTDPRILAETQRAACALGFDAVLEPPAASAVASNVRVRGGLREHLRFFHVVAPALRRKCTIDDVAIKSDARLDVAAVEDLGVDMLMYDVTTTTGDFIANGVVSHNCYARPGHEYLSFGAGTDFDRKIVVKPRAPELLREAFEKKSWKGELVMFSGVTDCYQPLEASYRLTRGCLEVCAEYKNPVALITKSPLVERDIDVLVKLHEVTSLRVVVSVPFWNADNARAIEPYVATPQRRIHTIAKLADAGIVVGVNVAPIIPGLSDEDIGDILAAAKDAGARFAGSVVLRLPGPVKDVFVERLTKALPLRAEKVLARIREVRGGKLYDARFGVRGTGEGVYADAIAALFEQTARRLGLDGARPDGVAEASASTFERPTHGKKQLTLF